MCDQDLWSTCCAVCMTQVELDEMRACSLREWEATAGMACPHFRICDSETSFTESKKVMSKTRFRGAKFRNHMNTKKLESDLRNPNC